MFRRQVQSIFRLLLTLFFMIGASDSVSAADDQYIEIRNETGKRISYISIYNDEYGYVYTTGTDIRDGDYEIISLDSRHQYWDIEIYVEGKGEYTWYGVDLSGVDNIEFYRNGYGYIDMQAY